MQHPLTSEESRQALGPKLDLRELHDRVLENGTLALGMLRQVIARWIAEKKRGRLSFRFRRSTSLRRVVWVSSLNPLR